MTTNASPVHELHATRAIRAERHDGIFQIAAGAEPEPFLPHLRAARETEGFANSGYVDDVTAHAALLAAGWVSGVQLASGQWLLVDPRL